MGRGVNKVILVGNLGGEPETSNGCCRISIATSEAWKDKNTGELQEKTEWHKVVFFGKVAETVQQYLHKGSKVYIEGKLSTSKYTKDGVDMYSTSIQCREMQMLDSKNGGAHQGENGYNNGGGAPSYNSYPQPQNQGYTGQSSPPNQGGHNQNAPPPQNADGGFDQDVPF